MNIIDLMAICPFYISLILEGLEDFEIIGKTSKMIRLVREILKTFDHGPPGEDNEDLEDFQIGSTLCRPPIALLYLAAGVSGLSS